MLMARSFRMSLMLAIYGRSAGSCWLQGQFKTSPVLALFLVANYTTELQSGLWRSSLDDYAGWFIPRLCPLQGLVPSSDLVALWIRMTRYATLPRILVLAPEYRVAGCPPPNLDGNLLVAWVIWVLQKRCPLEVLVFRAVTFYVITANYLMS